MDFIIIITATSLIILWVLWLIVGFMYNKMWRNQIGINTILQDQINALKERHR